MPSRITRCFILLFVFHCCLLTAQNAGGDALSVSSFTLRSGTSSKVIYADEVISIYCIKKGRNDDSLYRRYNAAFVRLERDSIHILANGFSENRLYELPRDSSRFNSVFFGKDSTLTIPLSEVANIYYNRSRLKNIATLVGAVSILSALIIGPIVSFESGGFNNQRFESIAGVSFSVLAASIVTGCGWGQKNYRLVPNKKSKRVWLIQQP